MRTRHTQSSSSQSKVDVHHAWLPCAAHRGPVCLYLGPDHGFILTDWWFIHGPGIRFRVRSVLASLAIPIKKGEKILRGSLHSVRGSIGLGLETLVIGSQVVYFCLFLAFITAGLCLYFYCYCLKLQYTFLLLIQSLYSMFVTISILCSIFLVLLDIDNMSWVLHTYALVGSCS